MDRRWWRACAWVVGIGGCVAAPQAGRSGGTSCNGDVDCNPGAACGEIHLCVQGFCAEDAVFRVCVDGGYPDTGGTVGQCITYVDCNVATCGPVVPCISGVCEPTATPLYIPCGDGGTAGTDP